MIKKISIYDFDGTVVDSSHRYRTMPCGTRIDLQHWIDNEHRTLEDSLLPLAEQFKQECEDPSVFVIVATARIWCEQSIEFCVREGLKPQKVVARLDREDTRGGAELKIQGIRPLLNLKQFKDAAIHVYEDNVSYLKTLCDTLNATGHYYPSEQGH